MVLVTTLAGESGATYKRPGSTERVSLNSDGTELEQPAGNVVGGCVTEMDITPDGRFVAFTSYATNIVEGDTNFACDVFVRDRKRDTTERVSISDTGAQAQVQRVLEGIPSSTNPSISANGRYVAFESSADNLVSGDTNDATDVFVFDRKTRGIERVSVSSGGDQTHREDDLPPHSKSASISGDGRYVAFQSAADYLVPNEPGSAIYRHDRKTGTTIGVSYDAKGELVGAASPSISGDGRYVVWSTGTDVYVRDTDKEKTILASITVGGIPSQGGTPTPEGNVRICVCDAITEALGGKQISANGRYVVFASTSPDLVPSDSNWHPDSATRPSSPDIFVRDLVAERTERISVRPTGAESARGSWLGGSGAGYSGSISSDGRYVTFTSAARDLVHKPRGPDEPASGSQCVLGVCAELLTAATFAPAVFVHDRLTGELTWASQSLTGRQPDGGCALADELPGDRSAFSGAISDGGRYALFASCGTDLVDDDENDVGDYFVRDRGQDVGVGHLEGPPDEANEPDPGTCVGEVCVPPVCVADVCIPPDQALTAGDESESVDQTSIGRAANLLGLSIAYRPSSEDLFFKTEVEHLSVLRSPHTSISSKGPIYAVGFEVASKRYEVRMSALKKGSFGLFECGSGPVCTELARLEGGFGTTGHRLTFALPLSMVDLQHGGELDDVEAVSGLGAYVTRTIKVLDRITFE